MACPDHPRYQGKRRPARNCIACWTFYSELHPPEEDEEVKATRCRQCGLLIEPGAECRSCGWRD